MLKCTTHTFYVLVFLTKHIFGFKDKNYDIYVSCILDLCPYATYFNVFKYHVFVFQWVLGKIRFPIEKSKFDKIQVLVFGKNVKTQKWFHMLDIWVEMFITSLYINAKW